MKSILLIATICGFLAGCSTYYTVENYPSREKYFEDFNKAAKGESLKVVLLNDSTVSLGKNAEIENDSLYLLNPISRTDYYRIPISEIKRINYSGTDFKSAFILLKNNERLNAERIIHLKDSLEFYSSEIIVKKDVFVSIDKIKAISYKRRWPGIIPGVLIGAPLGGFFAVITKAFPTYEGDNKSNTRTYDYFTSFLIGSVSGLVIGGVVGWLVGFNYTYRFNP